MLKKVISFLFIFFFSFSFFYFLTSHLPFSFQNEDDILWINIADSNNWSSILTSVFVKKSDYSLLSPLIATRSASPRPIHAMLTKLLLYFFGFNPAYFYLSRAIIFAFLCVAIFLLAERTIYNKSLRFLIIFFYMTIPPIFYAYMWLADISILAQLFLLMSLLCYLKLFFQKKKSCLLSFLLQFGVLFFFFLALRTKETAILLVPILALFTLIQDWQKLKQYKLLFFFLFFIVFYFLIYNSTGDITDHIYSLIFKDKFQGLGIEKTSAIFSPMAPIKIVPSSLPSILGFFLSWIIIFLFIYIGIMEKWFSYIYNKFIKYSPTNYKFSNLSNVYLIFFGVWFFIEVAFVSYIGLGRHLVVGGVLPLIFLVFLIIDKFILLFEVGFQKIVFALILIVVLFSLAVNTYNTSIRVVEDWGDLNIKIDKAVNIILDYEIKEGFFSNYRVEALAQAYDLLPNKVKLKDIVLSDVYRYPFNAITKQSIRRVLSMHPRAYIISSKKMDFSDDYFINVPALKSSISTISLQPCSKGLYCKFKQKIDQILGRNISQPEFLYIFEKRVQTETIGDKQSVQENYLKVISRLKKT